MTTPQPPLFEMATVSLEHAYRVVPADALTAESWQHFLSEDPPQLFVPIINPTRGALYIVTSYESGVGIAYLDTNKVLHVVTGASNKELSDYFPTTDSVSNSLRLYTLYAGTSYNRGFKKGRISIPQLLERHLPLIGWQGEIPLNKRKGTKQSGN